MSNNLDMKFAKMKEDVDQAIRDAYLEGFNAGSAADKPTQEEFNAGHKEPLGYGEDGEIYVLAGDYTAAEAKKLFKAYFSKELFDTEYINDVLSHIEHTKVAYMPEEVSSDPGYYYRRDGTGVYDAWVWTA